MGLGSFLKKALHFTVDAATKGTMNVNRDWRADTKRNYAQMFGQHIGNMISSADPMVGIGETLNADESTGESKKAGLFKLLQLAAMAATAGGYGPFAGAGATTPIAGAGATTPTLSTTATPTMLPSATGVAYGSFSAPAEFSAGIPYNRIPIEMAYHAPAGGFLDAIGNIVDAVGNIPVDRSNLSKLWQAQSNVGAIGRPILRQEQANRLSDLQNEQIKMYLLKLAMAKKKPYQMSQPIYEQRNLWA